MNTNLEIIRAACIKANPEFESKNTSMMLKGPFTGLINYRDPTIRLAEVLLAIRKANKGTAASTWGLNSIQQRIIDLWNLRLDDLAQQSEETLAFIVELLK